MHSPELSIDVLTHLMCISTLTCTDLFACLTVCDTWYRASIRQLIHVIYVNSDWPFTFWLDYIQRHTVLSPCVLAMHVNGVNIPFSFILLNDVLTLCPNLQHFHARNLDLHDLQHPAFFLCPVEIKLSACLFSSGGVHALLAYSAITCITIIWPSFPPATTPDPVFYGVPCLMRCVSITRASLWDVIRLFNCMPTYLAVFETVELDVIQGTIPNTSTLGRHIIVPSLGAAVKRLLMHSVGVCFVVTTLCILNCLQMPSRSSSYF